MIGRPSAATLLKGVRPVHLVGLLSAYLMLMGLGNAAFWDDEARVALLASRPVWDGRNLIADLFTRIVDGKPVNLLAQLDHYVVALSFKVFGASTWAGRLPFVLAGLAMLPLWWRTLQKEFPDEPAFHLYAFAGTALSVNFLLYSRNCRYYSLGLFFAVALLYSYRRFLETRSFVHALMGTGAAIFLCLTSALYCAALLAALGLRHLLFHRSEWDRAAWFKVLAGACVFTPVAALYVSRCIPPVEKALDWTKNFTTLLGWNLQGLNLMNALPWQLAAQLLAVLLVVTWLEERAPGRLRVGCRTLLEYLVMLCGYLISVSALSPQLTDITSIADLRYLVPLIPVCAFLCAGAFWTIHTRWPALAVSLLFIQLNSNLLAVLPGDFGVRLLLPSFVGEVHSPYPTAVSRTVQFLKQMVPQDAVVWIFPDYMAKPIQFYAGDRVKIRGVLENDSTIRHSDGDRLDPRLYVDRCNPDWVILFGSRALGIARVQYYSGGRTIQPITLDVFEGQSQRPELPMHTFGPVRKVDMHRFGVYLYKINP